MFTDVVESIGGDDGSAELRLASLRASASA
jgi:hypothetical protein